VDRSYEISARGVGGINRALLELGPRHRGRAAHALTGWRLSWSYVPTLADGVCLCRRPRVQLELETTLPRWREAPRASDELRRDWSLFLGRLRSHEAVHQDLAVENGRELLGLMAEVTAGDCESLRTEVERRASRVAGRYRDLHSAFDRRTRFGREPEDATRGENARPEGR
jgi:predicted secreted Zn-dependent protease